MYQSCSPSVPLTYCFAVLFSINNVYHAKQIKILFKKKKRHILTDTSACCASADFVILYIIEKLTYSTVSILLLLLDLINQQVEKQRLTAVENNI